MFFNSSGKLDILSDGTSGKTEYNWDPEQWVDAKKLKIQFLSINIFKGFTILFMCHFYCMEKQTFDLFNHFQNIKN